MEMLGTKQAYKAWAQDPDPYKRINYLGHHMKLKGNVQYRSGKPQSLELEQISLPSLGINCIKDSNPGDWLESKFDVLVFLSKFTELNPLENIKEPYSFYVGNDLMWNFAHLPINSIGEVTLNGKKATKYTVSFDKSNIEYALITRYFMQYYSMEHYRKFGFSIDFYVVDEDIVKYTYKWDGETFYSPQNLFYKAHMYLDMEFENYGKQLEIKMLNNL
ncbi:MAG TPA: hypothetical protein VD757_02300 [Candidatus Nitrosocosmicus sp.]|nr:hypothetical protein [Candidatus Nitrosocosmicus sp.]